MGRIKGIDNLMGINIHVTKEFVNAAGTKTIVGEQTNWRGDNTGLYWVALKMIGDDDCDEYVFASSEEEAMLLSSHFDDLKNVNYDICIKVNRRIEEFTGWGFHDSANSNFQTCSICNYMYYEAIECCNVTASFGEDGFKVVGDIVDSDTNLYILHFIATPGIDAYDIKYYKDGKEIDGLELGFIEASDICGVGSKDIDNALYYVVSNEVFNAIAASMPIQIMDSAIARIDDKNNMQYRKIIGKEWVKDLFNEGSIDRFTAEFMYTMINKW